jgi:hypothetical protein
MTNEGTAVASAVDRTRGRRSAIQIGSAALIAAALLGASAGFQRLREQRYQVSPVSEESLYLTSGHAVRQLTKGYNALAADLYWIRAIQYFGTIRLAVQAGAESAGYPLLYPLLDITTSLDPLFNIAYRFGAIFLAEEAPGGAGRPDLAIALLGKGLQAQADKWEYMWDIGFVHYWWRHDYREAAAWFDRASRQPGAPWWLQSLAATTLAEGGDRRSSRMMWEAIRQSAEVDYLRRDAERKLAQLLAMDQIDELQRAADAFAARTGAPPRDWAALVRARILPGTPQDPGGTPYEIDELGRVRLSRTSPLFPLPSEPRRPFLPS